MRLSLKVREGFLERYFKGSQKGTIKCDFNGTIKVPSKVR